MLYILYLTTLIIIFAHKAQAYLILISLLA